MNTCDKAGGGQNSLNITGRLPICHEGIAIIKIENKRFHAKICRNKDNFQKLYLGSCVVLMAKKGWQNTQNIIFAIEKLSAAFLVSLLVGYELISHQ